MARIEIPGSSIPGARQLSSFCFSVSGKGSGVRCLFLTVDLHHREPCSEDLRRSDTPIRH